MARPSAITKLADTETKGNKNWLIYGDPGSGKTPLAGTADKAIFLTVEAAGTESARITGSTADEWVCPTFTEFQKACAWLAAEGHQEYDWAIVDSLSEVEDITWTDLLNDANKEKGRSLYKPQLDDYQIVGNKMKRIVDSLNRLPINIIYTSHVQRVDITDIYTDDDSTLIMPALGSAKNGVLAQKIAGKMTLVGLINTRKLKKDEDMGDRAYDPRRLILQGSRTLLAKNRHGLPRHVDDPTIPGLVQMISAASNG